MGIGVRLIRKNQSIKPVAAGEVILMDYPYKAMLVVHNE